MTREEIRQLAEGIVNGSASDEEILLYNKMFNSFQEKGDQWKNEMHGDKDELEQSIRAAILQKTGLTDHKPKVRWLRWSAAASILLIIGIAAFFLFNNNDNREQPEKSATTNERFKNDVAPGQNGAILTLANGQQIVLDNAKNGSLPKQGSADVLKEEGQIVYTTAAKENEVVFNTMTTPRGRQYSLVLSDGSKVWLNAASSITFPTVFSGDQRKVNITGEAYFEVARSKNPFVVQKNDVSVTVLGTHFNVNGYEDEPSIKITLLEGAVKVTNSTGDQVLKPGQQAMASSNEKIKLINKANLEEVMAWKNGLFHFDNISVELLMKQLSRWYDVDIILNSEVNERFYADIPRSTKLSDALKALELTGKVKFGIDGKKIIVMP